MKTHSKTHPRNHHVIPMEGGTALLVFGSHCGSRSRIPDVVRHYKDGFEFAPMDKGRVFAANFGRSCCLVTKTRPGDLIVIAEPRHQGSQLDWLFLTVGEDFVPQTIEQGRKPSYSEIRAILANKQIRPSKSLALTNSDLRRLFQANVPSWLQSILVAQLEGWRERDLAAYVNFTPSAPGPGELDHCVTASPSIMLERWKTVIDARLLGRCIRLSPEGSVRYALAEIPDHLRENYLFENAAIALDVCQAQLTETDWCICARALPKETFELRMSLSTRNRAHILATLYKVLWPLPFMNPSAGERMEILESIRDHPDVWLYLHRSSFIQLFGKLDRLASIRPGLPEIDLLMNHHDEEVRNKIHEYIASQL
jgi:hypothetical protein